MIHSSLQPKIIFRTAARSSPRALHQSPPRFLRWHSRRPQIPLPLSDKLHRRASRGTLWVICQSVTHLPLPWVAHLLQPQWYPRPHRRTSRRDRPPEDVKLQDAAFVDPSVLSAAVRSEPSIGRSPILPPSPYSLPGSPSASEYTPSEAPITPAPADAEASRAPWYAPPERESRAQSLLRILSSRNRPPPRRQPTHDVDSGLRLYNEATLPPPYTPD